MISKRDDGTVLLQMGNGTLYSGIVRSEDTNDAVGICFSNSKDSIVDGVVFSINSMQGVAGYIRPLITLFEEFEKNAVGSNEDREAFKREIADFKKTLDPFMPKEKEIK